MDVITPTKKRNSTIAGYISLFAGMAVIILSTNWQYVFANPIKILDVFTARFHDQQVNPSSTLILGLAVICGVRFLLFVLMGYKVARNNNQDQIINLSTPSAGLKDIYGKFAELFWCVGLVAAYFVYQLWLGR